MKYSIWVIFFVILAFPLGVYAIDSDEDGITDELEVSMYYTDPKNPDTDGDGYPDGTEVLHDYSPHAGNATRLHEHDYDNDGLNDWVERWFHTDIGLADTDADGSNDFDEVMRGRMPTDPTSTSTFERRIVVDRTLQRLYYYVDGIKLLNMPVSTGNPDSETPEGEFTIDRMIEEKSYVGPGYDLPGVKWNMQFKPMYYIHAAYWHNDFGKRTHSHGCVNMTEANAGVLYKYMDIGVPVAIEGVTPSDYAVGT
jgi:hypothetical protein